MTKAREVEDEEEQQAARLRPRRLPRQARSRTVFDTIATTARRLFAQHGYANVTTNDIAEAANISIGSIYQYFSDKESIALCVYERACTAAVAGVRSEVATITTLPLNLAIVRIVALIFEIFDADQYALTQLIEEVPKLGSLPGLFTFDSLIHQTTQTFVEKHFPDADPRAIVRKSYVIETVTNGFVVRFLQRGTDFLTREEACEEIAGLIEGYLAPLAAT